MNHQGTQILETDRLILRPFCPDDAPAMFRNWAGDPEVTRFLRWSAHESPDASREILTQWISQYEDPAFYQWAIVLKSSGDEPIGSISVVEQDERIDMAHVGYCIGRPWWHQGITSEALARILRFLFEQVGANRVESQHDPNNPNSGKVMEKCGMRYEGTLRQGDRSNRGRVDAALYSILAADYAQGTWPGEIK